MKNPMKIFVASLFAAAAMSATACNTVDGAGEDVESVGDEVEDVTDQDGDS